MSEYNYWLLNGIGKNVYIGHDVIIKRPNLVRIGSDVAIDAHFVCTTKLTLGDKIHISYGVTIIGGEHSEVTLENFTTIAAGSHLIAGSDDYNDHLLSPVIPIEYRKIITSPILLKPFSSICTNCVVSPGVVFGMGSVLGANSFVKENTVLDEWTIYAGNPCRPIKKRNKENILRSAAELGYKYE